MGRDFDFVAYSKKIQGMVAGELAGALSAAAIGEAMGRLAALAEETLDECLDGREREHIACRAGCGICCVVNVSVLFPEAVAIVEHAQRCFSKEDLARLRKRIDELYLRSRWLDDEERLFLRRPCAFLNDSDACAIYPVRPLLCRSVTSTDPQSCLQAIAMPALEESKPVLMNLFQKSLMNATFEGLGQALEELGLDSRGMRLTEAVKRLLDEPELVAGFAAGGRMSLS
jgi:Fe-S-cluster containining protein